MLKLDALQKYENALLENFSPSVLRELKRSNWNGLLREIDRLYSTMYHEWDALQKDVVDLEDAVRSLTWTVNPYSRDGEEPGDLAREIAQLVTDALWAKAPHEPGAIGHTFPQLLGALVHHRLRGFNVHQIVWRKAGDMVYPARYIQLPPQFMVWETKAGHPDRLLLVEDGMSADGVPFPPHKYIVALNHNGPDHPLYNATFYSLVNWFVAFKFGLGWFMEYAQKYGMPKQVIRYANEKDRQQIVDDLSDESVLNTVLIKEGQGSGFEMQYPTGGAASLPQAVLVQKAEEACHKAILGQTLTSDTSASGGSLAQAKVHAGVQADVVMKLAEAVADILNQQLIPAIIQANYGRVQGLPIPELRCKLPQAVASIERAQFLKTALEIPGMKVVKSEAYEYLNLSQPGNDDEVFEAKDPAQEGMGGFGGGFPPGGGGEGGKGGFPDSDAKDEVVMSSRAAKKNDPAEAWLAPLKEKLREARSSGASLSELKEQIRAWKPNTRALADAMAQNIAAGYARGAQASQAPRNGNVQQEEEVRAENPYGCNQHGHGWVDACPYGGGGSNGLAGKSALQFAGGAENVNPDPDDDEEDKKKKEAEAKAKAEEEARKKAEAEKKAKEEAERKAREEEERKAKEAADAAQKAEAQVDEDDKLIDAHTKRFEDDYEGLKDNAAYKAAMDYIEELKAAQTRKKEWLKKLKSADINERNAALDSRAEMEGLLNRGEIEKRTEALTNELNKAGFDKYIQPQLDRVKALRDKYQKEIDAVKNKGGKMTNVQKTALRYMENVLSDADQKIKEKLEPNLKWFMTSKDTKWPAWHASQLLNKMERELDKRVEKLKGPNAVVPTSDKVQQVLALADSKLPAGPVLEKKKQAYIKAASASEKYLTGCKKKNYDNIKARETHKLIQAEEDAKRALLGDDLYLSEERQKESIPQKLLDQLKQTKTKLNARAKQEVEAEIARRKPVMKIGFNILMNNLLNDKCSRILNFTETGTDPSYNRNRMRSEAKLEGTEDNDFDGRNHPLCALLERSVGGAINNHNTGSYGDIFLEFVPEVRERTTFTGCNSLNSYCFGVQASSLVSRPTEGQPFTNEQIKWLNKGGSLNDYQQNRIKTKQEMPYIEAQVRGLLTTSHIRSIGVPKEKVYGGYWSGVKRINPQAKKEAEQIAKKLMVCTSRKTRVIDAGNHYLVEFAD